MMYYLLLTAIVALCNALQKTLFYNPLQIYYTYISFPATTSQTIIMEPKSKKQQNIVEYPLKHKELPDYKIPQWVHEKVFRHNKPNKYAFDKEEDQTHTI